MFNLNIDSNKSIKYRNVLYFISTITLICGLLFVFLYKTVRFELYIPSLPCTIHDILHLYCPGCGGTRAVKSLLNFNLAKSLLCNPFVLYLVVIFLYYYIGTTIAIITKHKLILFYFKFSMLYLGIILFFGSCIVRNILAIYYKIDYLGDICPYWTHILR